jgi:hypothetical protein
MNPLDLECVVKCPAYAEGQELLSHLRARQATLHSGLALEMSV